MRASLIKIYIILFIFFAIPVLANAPISQRNALSIFSKTIREISNPYYFFNERKVGIIEKRDSRARADVYYINDGVNNVSMTIDRMSGKIYYFNMAKFYNQLSETRYRSQVITLTDSENKILTANNKKTFMYFGVRNVPLKLLRIYYEEFDNCINFKWARTFNDVEFRHDSLEIGYNKEGYKLNHYANYVVSNNPKNINEKISEEKARELGSEIMHVFKENNPTAFRGKIRNYTIMSIKKKIVSPNYIHKTAQYALEPPSLDTYIAWIIRYDIAMDYIGTSYAQDIEIWLDHESGECLGGTFVEY